MGVCSISLTLPHGERAFKENMIMMHVIRTKANKHNTRQYRKLSMKIQYVLKLKYVYIV